MKKNNFRKIFRNLHRDLGYLCVGLSIIYGVSGIILNIKKQESDPAYKETHYSASIQKGLLPNELEEYWEKNYANTAKLNRVMPVQNQFRLFVNGGMGAYNPQDGALKFVVYKRRPLVKMINEIHMNSGKRFTWIANAFAGIFLFLAISGIIMIKGKKGFLKRGWWLVLAGVIIPLVWYYVTN